MIKELKNPQKILVGLSGGVDSAVSAALLQQLGHEVIACTLNMFDAEATNQAIASAKEISDFLKIEHIVIDCKAAFSQNVSNYLFRYYKSGKTPNPCIMCNQNVKFAFLNKTRQDTNAAFLATGHYCDISIINDEVILSQGRDLKKDQSYFLYRVSREILKKTLFPLSNFEKAEVKKIARELKIPVNTSYESTDICFINNKDYTAFLEEYSGQKNEAGPIFDLNGNFLGHHLGTEKYTIGQRKGLGLSGGPYYVKKIDHKKNTIIVADKESVKAEVARIANVIFLNKKFQGRCYVKFRSSGLKILSELCEDEDGFFIRLIDTEYGLAPGQHAVFYQENQLLGGGEIILDERNKV